MRLPIYIFILSTTIASCSGKSLVYFKREPKENSTQNETDNFQNNERDRMMLAGLKHSFATSNYCALVKQTKLASVDLKDEVKTSKINASVIEVFLGESGASITYEITMDAHEETTLSPDTILLCLCKRNGEYLWPGTGSIFSNDELIVGAARMLGKEQHSSDPLNCTE